jgi:plastocyanin
MAPKFALSALALCFVALAGCTGGSDSNDDGNSTTSGSGGIGGGVSGPGGVGGNATVSGGASGSSTNTSTNSSAPDTAEVVLASNAFTPEDVTIKMGGTVTWRHNDGDNRHTVTSDDAAWDSHPSCASPVTPLSDCMDNGDTFDQTFPTIGTFSYHCKIHPDMTGVVNVVEE